MVTNSSGCFPWPPAASAVSRRFSSKTLTPRRERIPQQFDHPNQVKGIEKVTVAVGELGRIEQWYGALLGAKGRPVSDPSLSAEGMQFEAGPHVMEFLTPRAATSPLADWLRRFGPSPYSAVLKAPGEKTLDLAYTHGANFFLG